MNCPNYTQYCLSGISVLTKIKSMIVLLHILVQINTILIDTSGKKFDQTFLVFDIIISYFCYFLSLVFLKFFWHFTKIYKFLK